MFVQQDLPKKKKIVLRSHKKSQLSVEIRKKPDNTPIMPLEKQNCEEMSGSNIVNIPNNNNSLEIYEDDRRRGFMFLLDNEEDKIAMEDKPQIYSEQKFSVLKIQRSKETSVNGESERNSLPNSQVLIKMQSPPTTSKGFHKKGCISVSTIIPKPELMQNRTRSLVTSPNKKFLHITLKSSTSNSPNSSFIKKNIKSINTQAKEDKKDKNTGHNLRTQSNIQRNLIQLSSSCLNFKILRRCASRSDKISMLAIKSQKYGELQTNFNKKVITKCNSIRLLTTENGLNK